MRKNAVQCAKVRVRRPLLVCVHAWLRELRALRALFTEMSDASEKKKKKKGTFTTFLPLRNSKFIWNRIFIFWKKHKHALLLFFYFAFFENRNTLMILLSFFSVLKTRGTMMGVMMETVRLRVPSSAFLQLLFQFHFTVSGSFCQVRVWSFGKYTHYSHATGTRALPRGAFFEWKNDKTRVD